MQDEENYYTRLKLSITDIDEFFKIFLENHKSINDAVYVLISEKNDDFFFVSKEIFNRLSNTSGKDSIFKIIIDSEQDISYSFFKEEFKLYKCSLIHLPFILPKKFLKKNRIMEKYSEPSTSNKKYTIKTKIEYTDPTIKYTCFNEDKTITDFF